MKRLAGAFLVVALLAAVAYVVLPDVTAARERGRQTRTMASLRMIGTAIESYQVDRGCVPRASSIDELALVVAPTFVRALPQVDAWGNPFRYESWAVEGGYVVPGPASVYVIRSAGSDGVYDHEDPYEYRPGLCAKFSCDLVFGGLR